MFVKASFGANLSKYSMYSIAALSVSTLDIFLDVSVVPPMLVELPIVCLFITVAE